MDEEGKSQLAAQLRPAWWAALAAAGSFVVYLGLSLYSNAQTSGANTVMLQTHSAEIASLQSTASAEQISLAAIQSQLATITQKLDDMQDRPGK